MIADAIRQAQRMHRAVVEETYDSMCRIYEKKPVKDPETKVTRQEEVLVQDEIPCHLSFSGISPTMEKGMAAAATQTIKLFLAPELVIRPGSRIEVIHQERTESYGQSGKSAVYSSHQEILLELWEEKT